MAVERRVHPRYGISRKVTSLTDAAYRVWMQYLQSADDFGVMRATPLAFQNVNDYLARRSPREIQKQIELIISAGLTLTFVHQGRPYFCQTDWQLWQKIDYTRVTLEPLPPA